jgi:hypothetical protein
MGRGQGRYIQVPFVRDILDDGPPQAADKQIGFPGGQGIEARYGPRLFTAHRAGFGFGGGIPAGGAFPPGTAKVRYAAAEGFPPGGAILIPKQENSHFQGYIRFKHCNTSTKKEKIIWKICRYHCIIKQT